MGSLILRTADNSEHEVSFFTYKYKKDENRNFTSEEGFFYKAYKDAMETLVDMEHCVEGQKPDIISITDGSFTVNDFKASDGNVVTTNRISARFINRVDPRDYDNTILEAKFEVEGIIEKISDEIVKDVPTGNLIVTMNAISQRADGFGRDANYEVDSLIPIRMKVDKSMAEGFRGAGYYEGCFTKLTGILVNTVEIQEIVEKAAFGPDIKKQIKSTVKKNEVKSGIAPSTIFEHELSQEVVEALKAKRRAKLEEVKSNTVASIPFTPTNEGFPKASTPPVAPMTSYNPFAR